MSNKKIAELLAVLDMTKFEQKDWVRHNSMPYLWRGSLADLAFRLRDEVANGKLKIANGRRLFGRIIRLVNAQKQTYPLDNSRFNSKGI